MIRTAIFIIIYLVGSSSFQGSARAASRKGYSDILRPRFILADVIDPGRDEFSHAAELREDDGVTIFRAEILGVILESGFRGKFDPWPPRADAILRADLFMKDKYILGIHSGYKLSGNIGWSENPSGSTNWEFNLLAMDVLANATEAFRQTGDRKYLDKGRLLILDFIEDNYDPEKLPSAYSWYDHSVAYRTIHTIDFWREWLKMEENDEKFTAAFIEFIWRHAKYLEKEKYYSKKTNHGMYANIAQLRLSLAFPQFRDADRWRETAITRMEKQLKDNYTKDGIHKEYSTSYHILTTKLVSRFRADCVASGNLTLSPVFDSLIQTARRNIAWLIHPEGFLSLIGDSSLGSVDRAIGSLAADDPVLEWILTSGKGGTPPENSSAGFMDAQLFVMRSGWGEKRPFRDESYLIADFCPYGKAHQHDDFLSFEFSSLGVRWFTDLGVFNYNTYDQGRKYVISPLAHNIIVPVEDSRRIVIREKQFPGKRGKGKTETQIEAMLDQIESITSPSARIGALLQVMEREIGGLEPRVLLIMAMSYEELGGNQKKARECLERIIKIGSGSGYQEIAVQLLDMLDVDVEDMVFDDSSDMEIHMSGVKEKEKENGGEKKDPVLVEEIRKPSLLREDSRREKRSQDEVGKQNVEVTSVPRIVRPDHGQTPRVHHWITNDDYDYLEGSYNYSKLFQHGRAILFVKPQVIIIVDRIMSKGELSFRQLFHLDPSVTAERSDRGYMLSGPEETNCIFSCMTAPPDVKSTVIEGQRHPEMQGWYSGTFDNLEPAQVIEYSFKPEGPGSSYFAHVIMPVPGGAIDDYSLDFPGKDGEEGWSPGSVNPLELIVEGPEYRTVVSFSLSSLFFTGSSSGAEVVKPRITISHEKR